MEQDNPLIAPESPAPPPAAPRQERYNTQFLVGNLEKDARRTRLIIVAVAGLIVLAIGLALHFSSHEAPKPRSEAGGDMAPTEPSGKAPAPSPKTPAAPPAKAPGAK